MRVRTVAKLAPLLDARRLGRARTPWASRTSGSPIRPPGRLLATRAALADARRRADDAAAVVGMRITGVRTVSLDPDVAGLRGRRPTPAPSGAASQNTSAVDPRRGRARSSSPSACGWSTPRRRSPRDEQQRGGDGAAADLGPLPPAARAVAQAPAGDQRGRAAAVEVQRRRAAQRRHQRGQLFQRQARRRSVRGRRRRPRTCGRRRGRARRAGSGRR